MPTGVRGDGARPGAANLGRAPAPALRFGHVVRALFRLVLVLGVGALGAVLGPGAGRAAPAAARPGPSLARAATATLSAAERATSSSASRAAAPRRAYAVAALGDSLTDERVGGGRYLAVLRERCPESRFDAYGVGGQRTDHFRWRIDTQILDAGRYSHVVVLGGINDLAAGVAAAPVGRTQANLASLYERARARGVAVVAVTLPPWTRDDGSRDARRGATARVNQWILERVGTGDVDRAVDVFDALRCGGELCPEYRRFPDDLVHWNERGHRVVGERLFTEAFADCR